MNSIIIANWKMNMTLSAAIDLATELETIDHSYQFLIAPPAPYLAQLASFVKKNKICAQDVSFHGGFGAYTGESSADIIKSCGINYAIIGHSERRFNQKESNELIYSKVDNCLSAGIIPIICVGEPLDIRANNSYREYITQQINSSIPKGAPNIIIAYEPIWSIGSGNVPTIEQISEVIELIKNNVKLEMVAKTAQVVYGGSVNSKNFAQILKINGLDGILIGAASMNWSEMNIILKS